METPPDDVVLAPPHTVLKTSSGKLRRAASRELYEQGRIGVRPRALRWQIARLTLAALVSRARDWWRAAGAVLYAAYWWTVVGILAAITWPLLATLPRRAWRWAALRLCARLVLRLTVTPLAVEGADHLAPGGSVVVANHSSYIDHLALLAALPGEMAFVAKRELARQFFAGLVLRRIGTLFVERFAPEAGVEDTRKALGEALTGRRLLFYPEGTLSRRPGLLAFRLGSFVVAAEAGVPVTPVTIRGTRSVLRGGQWFPRRGKIVVSVAPPLMPEGSDWAAAVRLRDQARAVILERCGEPDLAQEDTFV